MARDRVAERGLSGRVECVEGDFCELPPDITAADLVYAIESFVHGPDPSALLRSVSSPHETGRPARHLRRREERCGFDRRHPRGREFMKGWHINTLLDRDTLVRLAGEAGFVHESTLDLTPLLEIKRIRDRPSPAVWRC